MTGPPPKLLNDRTKNHLMNVYKQQPDGTWKEIRVPYPCDDCGEPAVYGCIRDPGRWLRCGPCHIRVVVTSGNPSP